MSPINVKGSQEIITHEQVLRVIPSTATGKHWAFILKPTWDNLTLFAMECELVDGELTAVAYASRLEHEHFGIADPSDLTEEIAEPVSRRLTTRMKTEGLVQ